MNSTNAIMLPELFEGVLIKRYKRFLADIKLSDGSIVTAHSANTGSMRECSEPGRPVWLSYHDKPARKYKYSWEIIDMGGSLVGINTGLPNRLVKLSAEAGLIEELSGYDSIKPEVKTADGSRLDLGLYQKGRRNCYVEIKNSTLVENGLASFPDAVTKRGLKHLKELQRLVKENNRAVMFFLIQRMDAAEFQPAYSIDPDYAAELFKAEKNGVEVVVYDSVITTEYIKIGKKIPFKLKNIMKKI